MLRNSYIEHYKPKSTKSKFMEREIALFHTDLNKIIYSQRPISTKSIRRLPKSTFPVFIDDIMCNNKVNTLLYSSNANKETNFYLKQKYSLLNYNPENAQSPKKNKLSPLGAIMLKRSNIQIINSLKEKIAKFLIKRNQIFDKYKEKQENFEKNQPNMDIKLKRLYYKPVNEIRLEGYKKAFKECLKKSKSDEHFELPNIQFNMEDVYSRLANNVILNQKTLREKISKEKEKKEKEENDSYNNIRQRQINNLYNITNNKFKTVINNFSNKTRLKKKLVIKHKHNNSLNNEHKYNDIDIDINNFNFNYYYNLRNMPTLNISKILKFSSGKEFKIKITPRIKKRCLSVLSCGPKPRPPKVNLTSEKKDEEKEEEIDYKEIRNKSIFNISKSRTKENINNLILYNTLMVDKNNRGRDIVKVRNYRDENFNSNLHIAVLNDSIKLVKYFLNKKLDPNGVNNEGKTPLHLAMKKGNKNIIELLIKSGANTEFKDKKGKIPIDYASKEIKHYFIFESQ